VFSSTSINLIAGSSDCTVRIYDLKKKGLSHTISDHSSEVLSVSLSCDDTTLASSDIEGMIFTHKMKDLEQK